MDLIISTILNDPAFWNYDSPFHLLAVAALLVGMFLQILLLRKSRKLVLFPIFWLLLSLVCEYLYQIIRGFEAFGPALFGIFTYLSFFGSLLGILIYIIWTKVRHS